MMAAFKVVMWNWCKFHAPEDGFFENFSLAAFLETHHKHEDDFPDLINEYVINHHLIHAPTPTEYKHCSIVILVNKQSDILQSEIKIPGRMVNLKLAHNVTRHEYKVTV